MTFSRMTLYRRQMTTRTALLFPSILACLGLVLSCTEAPEERTLTMNTTTGEVTSVDGGTSELPGVANDVPPLPKDGAPDVTTGPGAPCQATAPCVVGNPDGVCVAGVCTTTCGTCPDGLTCQDAVDFETALPIKACLAGSKCANGTTEPCSIINTNGTCKGLRTCVDGAFGACSAAHPEAEACTGNDDDCDGKIDEDAVGLGEPCDGPDADSCKDGKTVCDAGKPACSDDAATSAETCNGKDDDCDGKTDEDIAGLAEGCDGADADLCKEGTTSCEAGKLVCSDTTGDVPEECNGKDDDCDTETDETYPEKDAACDGADADLCKEGTTSCEAGKLVCSDTTGDVPEECNGKDDDCDTETDETYSEKDAACDGPDEDQCTEGTTVCTDGKLACTDESGDTVELCNEKDDDCDGDTDETYAEKGVTCDGPDADGCAEGELQCAAGKVSCSDTSGDTLELCNDLDDDCDGQIDQTFGDKGAACDGADADQCKDGKWTCDGTGLVCTGDTTPHVELCNFQDDDCDGLVDEDFGELGLACDGADADQCTTGTWTCDGTGVTCTDDSASAIELCNDFDDDCDTQIDEDFVTKGQACDGNDDDKCADGKWTCTGLGLECSDDEESKVEVCNDADDDCDTKVDEDFPSKGLDCDGPDVDACLEGKWVCAGAVLSCDDATSDQVELCNGKDDDCDTQTDESFPNQGLACDGPDDPDQCKDGQVACIGGKEVCYDDAVPKDELCNGVDDDCDTETDEGFVGLGLACDGADADKCKDGKNICAADGKSVVCGDDAAAIAELCNGKDETCDGAIDETFTTLGEACDGSDEDKCKDGKLVCAKSGTGVECNDDAASVAELCNGKDDDCDGFTDEAFPTLGELCDGDDADQCKDGKRVCSADHLGVSCDDNAAAHAELCNGKDDDCDAQTDEDFPTKGQPCDGTDADSCKTGKFVCAADLKSVLCNDDAAATTEVCNKVDDDCDGQTDDDDACGCAAYTSGTPLRTYLVCQDKRDWSTAQSYCSDRGYLLANIGDATEEALLRFVLGLDGAITTGAAADYWIGLNDTAIEGTYAWIGGSNATYFNWAPGEPNNSGNEDCVQTFAPSAGETISGRWNDRLCTHKLAFVCESYTAK